MSILKVAMTQKPQVFFKSMTFNDGTTLILEHNSIVVFTGANNSGKSQVLRDVEKCLSKSATIVINDFECDYNGSIDETTFLNEHFLISHEGKYQLLESGFPFSLNTLQNYWKQHTFYNGFHKLFVKRLSTEVRLTSSNALNRNTQPEKHPIFKLHKSQLLAQKLSNYFRQAF